MSVYTRLSLKPEDTLTVKEIDGLIENYAHIIPKDIVSLKEADRWFEYCKSEYATNLDISIFISVILKEIEIKIPLNIEGVIVQCNDPQKCTELLKMYPWYARIVFEPLESYDYELL